MDFDFYDLPLCDNTKGHGYDNKQMGTSLRGTPLVESPYRYTYGVKGDFRPCGKTWTPYEMSKFSFYTQHNYKYKLYLDGLPSATISRDPENNEKIISYTEGIPIGKYNHETHEMMLYNHLEITVKGHETHEKQKRIVGFEVEPFSISEGEYRVQYSKKKEAGVQYIKADTLINFTYSIKVEMDPSMTWSTRLDHYVKIGENKIHWFQLSLSIAIIAICSLIAGNVLDKSLKKDFKAIELIGLKRQERVQARASGRTPSDEAESTGLTSNKAKKADTEDVLWKKLQGDVFRAPDFPHIFSTFVGIGVQVLVIIYIATFFFLAGFINWYTRTFLFYQGFIALSLASWPAGVTAARLMKFFGATEWMLTAIAVSFWYPTFLFSMFLLVDMIEWTEKSAQTVPFTSVVAYMILWMCAAIPLAFHGAYTGFLMKRFKTPTKVNSIRRENKPLPTYLRLAFAMPVFGVIIFGSIFAEFQYVLSSVWRSQVYAMFGYLFLSMNLLVAIVALISVIVTYLSLSAGHSQWWWRSFMIGASGAIYMSIYSVYYMIFSLQMDLLAGEIIYLVYMLLVSISFALMCGSISVVSSYVFVTRIYSNIKGE